MEEKILWRKKFHGGKNFMDKSTRTSSGHTSAFVEKKIPANA